MKEYICYKADMLIKLLGNNFRIINEEIEDNFSDLVDGSVDSKKENRYYITNMNTIQKIKEWSSLWNEINIYLTDGNKLTLHSENVNSNDNNLIRISKNNFFSPSFERQSDYILANKDLDQWLFYNGITQKQLTQITKTFQIYGTYIFKGVGEPIIEKGNVYGYYCNDMKIPENEIDKAIETINDIEMRFKIKAIIESFAIKYQ